MEQNFEFSASFSPVFFDAEWSVPKYNKGKTLKRKPTAKYADVVRPFVALCDEIILIEP